MTVVKPFVAGESSACREGGTRMKSHLVKRQSLAWPHSAVNLSEKPAKRRGGRTNGRAGQPQLLVGKCLPANIHATIAIERPVRVLWRKLPQGLWLKDTRKGSVWVMPPGYPIGTKKNILP